MKILLISDIHGNIYALNKILNNENYDNAIFIGDAVDYGPKPAEVIDKLKEIGAKGVMGNHDNAVVYNVDCKCGEKTHWISTFFRENYTKKLIDKQQINYLSNLKTTYKFEIDSFGRALITHGSPSSPLYGYLYPWIDEENFIKMLHREIRLQNEKIDNIKLEYDLYIIGHTHYQFIKKIKNSVVVNPGSAGEPRDNDNRAAYAVIDTENKSIELKRIKYDIEQVINDLIDLKIPDPYLSYLKYMFINGNVP